MLAAMTLAGEASADEATRWLERAARAAKTLNYAGTIVFQHNGHVDTSRLVHMVEGGQEQEKLLSLDGPAREVIRSSAEVRCYFPDAKVIRIEPRTFRNVFPSLSAEQLRNLGQYYEARMTVSERVAGHWTQVMSFEPKDGLRYGHKFWAEANTGLLLKARVVDDRGEVVEQFTFTDVSINEKLDREMVKPSWAAAPPDWQVKQGSFGDMVPKETGWSVGKAARRFPEDHGRLPDVARQARAGSPSRLFRRFGVDQRVRGIDCATDRADRLIAAGRAQCATRRGTKTT